MLPFGVTISSSVPQRSEIPEGLMNYPVSFKSVTSFPICIVNYLQHCETEIKGKWKVQPRTGHDGPKGKKRYNYTLSLTSAVDVVDGQRHAQAST
jgi:hypothetical protein